MLISIIEIIVCIGVIWLVWNEQRLVEVEDRIKREWAKKRQIKKGSGLTAGADAKIVRFNKDDR
jgi:hypothetical protein